MSKTTVLLVIIIIILLGIIYLQNTNPELLNNLQEKISQKPSGPQYQSVSIKEIVKNPDAWIDKKVSVTGTLDLIIPFASYKPELNGYAIFEGDIYIPLVGDIPGYQSPMIGGKYNVKGKIVELYQADLYGNYKPYGVALEIEELNYLD